MCYESYIGAFVCVRERGGERRRVGGGIGIILNKECSFTVLL